MTAEWLPAAELRLKNLRHFARIWKWPEGAADECWRIENELREWLVSYSTGEGGSTAGYWAKRTDHYGLRTFRCQAETAAQLRTAMRELDTRLEAEKERYLRSMRRAAFRQ